MRKLSLLVASAASVATLAALPAHAVTLVAGGGWTSFNFGATTTDPLTFTLSAPSVLEITDAFVDGDQFDFTINSVDQGPTSTPTDDGTNIGSDYTAAYASPLYTHGTYALGAGVYSVTGVVIAHATDFPGGGGAAAQLTAVPEPASWALMLVGFGALGFAARRRRAIIA